MNTLGQPTDDLFSDVFQLQDKLDEAEARLKMSGVFPSRIEQVYRAVMDNLLEGALIILANGTVIYCNQNFADMVQAPTSKIIGSKVSEFILPADLETFRTAFSHAQKIRRKCEVHLQGPDGHAVPVLFTMSAAFGNRSTVGAAVMNLSEQKEKEREQKRVQELLVKKQKREALGTLAGGIAHDLNNALFPIVLNTDMLLLDLPAESPSRSPIQTVKIAALRAKRLVEQILNFGSQGRVREKLPVDVVSVVDECLVLIKAGAPPQIEIQKDLLPDAALVSASSTQVHQVVMNLCTNAIHAMKEKGGVLKIEAKRYKLDRKRTGDGFELSPGAYIRVIVSDTGKGMSPEVMARVFDPYFTTKKRGEGTGLGLSITHQIVTDLGGGIAVQSMLEKGSSFEVFLPEMKGPKEEGAVLSKALPTGTESILLIDDEEICISSLTPALERLGYRVTAKMNSLEALRAFREHPWEFDLIVTDQSMPGLTGLDLSQEVMKIRPDLPIILVTGFSEAVDEPGRGKRASGNSCSSLLRSRRWRRSSAGPAPRAERFHFLM